jgi:hypothetical protein
VEGVSLEKQCHGMKKWLIIVFILVSLLSILVWWRAPLVGNEWSRQTVYVWLTDAWYGRSTDAHAHALWIDDDATEGVFIVKRIADELNVHPCFAVIADQLTPALADSLSAWQQQGSGIVLHGFRHDRWWDWEPAQIAEDIRRSYLRLQELGFDTAKIVKMVVPPHGCNNRTIRRVIEEAGCQMISGATLVNPDRHVFQLGRIPITPDTDTTTMRKLLQKAYDRKGFVIFGTHSSIPSSFSPKKTRQVLQMAKEIGFDFVR